MLAGAVTLLKLLNSFYASHVDVPSGRTLFGKTVSGLRALSVRSNDLPQRLAEVTAQLWQTFGASEQRLFNPEDNSTRPADDFLQLRVRCRSSLSILFDAIWRWRQQAQQNGRENLDSAVENPTAVGSGSHTSNTPQPPSLGLSSGAGNGAGAGNAGAGPGLGGGEAGPGNLMDENIAWDGNFGGNAVFDPLSWALDGNLQFQLPTLGGMDGLNFQV